MLRKLIRNRFPIPSQNGWESEEQAGLWSRRGAGEAEEGFAPQVMVGVMWEEG